MPALDLIHEAIKNALIKDGWVITHNPLIIKFKKATLYVDLGAESVIAAEREGQKIAIEIKTFAGRFSMHDLEVAVGQYIIYRGFLRNVEPGRKLYIAISEEVYDTEFQRESFQWIVQDSQIPLIVVNIAREEIVTWIN